MKTLDQIGLKYRTDKSSPYHNYLNTYEQYFKDFRNKYIQVWELGIGDIASANREGESGLMWRDYFENAVIRVFDNDVEKVKKMKLFELSNARIFAHYADQTELEDFIHIAPFSRPTIIIDDASHIQKNTIRSFEILFPLLKPGGLYCIEDLQTAYFPSWGGDETIFDFTKDTVMNYFFKICHYVNLKKQHTFQVPSSIEIPDFYKQIKSVHFHHGQIIILKHD